MKVTKEFVIRSIMDEYVIVPVGESAEQFGGIISTNSTGAFLWDKVQSDITREELISALLDEFDVSEADAESDVDLFIEELTKQKILETP